MRTKIALTVVLLLLMCGCLHVAAQDSIFFANEEKGITNTNYGHFTLTEYSGLFGKDSTQKSTLVEGQYTANSNKAWESFTIADEARSYSYLVMETNFVPKAGLKYCVLATSGGTELSARITGWKENRWNNIRYVYEFPGKNNDDGYVSVYLNGRCVIENTSLSTSVKNNQLRLAFNGTIGGDRVSVYTSDLKIYATDFTVRAQEYMSPEGLQVFSDRLYVKQSALTVKSITDNYGATRVYKDSNFSDTLTDNENLTEGNVVLYETADKLYSYYTVKFEGEDGRLVVSRTDTALVDDAIRIKYADITKASSVMGRRNDDESMCIELSEECLSGAAEIAYSLEDTDYPDYLCFGLSICPAEGTSISAETERGEEIAGRIYTLDSTLSANRWNYVAIVYNTSNHMADTYVNGKCVTQGTETLLGTQALYNSFKIMLHIPDGGNVYLDTIEISLSDSYPSVRMKKPLSAAYGIDGFMCENAVIDGILSTDSVRVYTDDTFTSLSQKEQVQITDFVVVEDNEERLQYYEVIDAYVYRDMLVNDYEPIIVTGNVDSASGVFSGVIYAVYPLSSEKTLIAAKYKEGILTEVLIGETINNMLSATILPDTDTDTVKIFVRDSLNTMIPRCDSELLSNVQ